jgi:hypothetical protein
MNKYKITRVLASLAIAGFAMTMTPLNAFANTGVTAAQSSNSVFANHLGRNFSTSKLKSSRFNPNITKLK